MAEMEALTSSTKTRIPQRAVHPAASDTAESPTPTSGSALVPTTTPCDSEDSQIFRGEPTKDDTEMDPAALETVEFQASLSGDHPVPATTSSDSEDSQMSCGEPNDDDTKLSLPLVVLEKR